MVPDRGDLKSNRVLKRLLVGHETTRRVLKEEADARVGHQTSNSEDCVHHLELGASDHLDVLKSELRRDVVPLSCRHCGQSFTLVEFVRLKLLLVFESQDVLLFHPFFELFLGFASALQRVTLFEYHHELRGSIGVEISKKSERLFYALELWSVVLEIILADWTKRVKGRFFVCSSHIIEVFGGVAQFRLQFVKTELITKLRVHPVLKVEFNSANLGIFD